ncbi:MAG: hypothetical protein H6492_03025 [Candidatus Paracaedibacteraceae bacterium]|nr:hypothetical protein [Candidatus Paracaedibacteraceae bacterium]
MMKNFFKSIFLTSLFITHMLAKTVFVLSGIGELGAVIGFYVNKGMK